jgi:hypothetical protein
MNPQNSDWEKKLQELEVEMNQKSTSSPKIETPFVQPLTSSESRAELFNSLLSQVKNWYEGLNNTGRIAVTVVGLIIGFVLLNSVLKLVTALISLAVLAVVLYLGYKFFISSQESGKF